MWSRPPQDTRRPGRLPFSSATKAPGPGVGGCVPSFPLSCVFSQDHSHSLFPPGAQGSPRGDFFAGLVGPLQSPLQPASRGNRVPLVACRPALSTPHWARAVLSEEGPGLGGESVGSRRNPPVSPHCLGPGVRTPQKCSSPSIFMTCWPTFCLYLE